MKVSVVASTRSTHQVTHQEAMAEGLRKLGVEVSLGVSADPKIKYVACWGWRLGAALRQQGHEVLVMERGYLGDRFAWTSLAWNGLNGRGTFPEYPDDGGERFRKHYTLSPWKEHQGECAVIMGQVPGDASLQGRNLTPWYEATAVLAADAYSKPVLFRNHPVAVQKGHKIQPRHTQSCIGELDEILNKAAVVITYNSNSAVDAVVAGVPAVAMDAGSMAWDVTGRNVGDLIRPDRESWAYKLAWKQWSLDEIKSGFALKRLLEVAQ